MVKRILSLVIASVATAGCITAYQEVSETAPSATLTFEKGYAVGAGLARASGQDYWLVENDTCAKPRRLAWFTFANDPTQSKRIAADQPVTIAARTRLYGGSGGLVSGQPGAVVSITQCQALARFTPETGRSYSIVHRTAPGDSCRLTVLDTETRSPPRDLVLREPAPCSDDALP